MQLSVLKIPENKEKQLNKAGIHTVEDLLEYYPRKYNDRMALTGILPTGQESVILFHALSVRYISAAKQPIVKMQGYECGTQIPIEVTWFNQPYLYEKLQSCVKQNILVAGFATYKPQAYRQPDRYEFCNPAVCDPKGLAALGLHPVYRKVPGMAEDYLRGCIYKAADALGRPAETVPVPILYANKLIGHADMMAELHYPSTVEALEEAKRRKLFDDLLYFALRIELSHRGSAIGSPFGAAMLQKTKALEASLPYHLTADQKYVVDDMLIKIRSGTRLNALVQGDVGTGKTIVAVLLMVAMAENGYQAALMAPTQILARQHYEELSRLVTPLGIKVAFVSGQKLKKAEQTALVDSIATGEAKLIVGTQALLSDTYQFQNLALVIEDEEHKYGVLQRAALVEKAALGTHTVTMSATPIPRTLAQTVYGNNVQLYSIKTKPAGRLPVKTGQLSDMNNVLNLVYREVKLRGHQAYVVCPMISPNEKVEGVATAENTYEYYKRMLEPHGITVGIVTGRTKKTDATEILSKFERNEVSVLVSTTVIEVGVNVPNATCIVIHNAERFGLAQLHQLRGRVVRGSDQGYCVLVSDDTENARLITMCLYTDGFKIAEMDLELRGAGDFLGSQQSGTEKYLAMALAHTDEYQQAQRAAQKILNDGTACIMLDKAISDHKNNVEGEMLC